MPSPDIKIHRIGFEKAVAHLTPDCELWRAGWSHDPQSDNWRRPLRLNQDGRLMAYSNNHWDSFTLTVNDVLFRDWEVRRVKC